MKKTLLLLLIVFISSTLYAQHTDPDPPERQKSLALQLGSQGVGLEFKYQLLQKLSARAGFSVLPVKTDKFVQSFSSDTDDQLKASFTNARILLDYPIIGHGVRLVAGAAYFFKADGTIESNATEGFNLGDRHFTAEEVGMMRIQADWKGLRPYAGLAFFRDFPNNRINVTLDLGLYHLGSPKVNTSSTGMLYLDDTNRRLLEDNLSTYQWMPLGQLAINYKF